MGNNAILDLRWTSSGIWALGESGLYIVSGDGVLSGSYDYGGRYLKAFSLDGDGTASLLLGKYLSLIHISTAARWSRGQ